MVVWELVVVEGLLTVHGGLSGIAGMCDSFGYTSGCHPSSWAGSMFVVTVPVSLPGPGVLLRVGHSTRASGVVAVVHSRGRGGSFGKASGHCLCRIPRE